MSKWISVNDSLPEENKRVLVRVKYWCFYDNTGEIEDWVVKEGSLGVVPPHKRKRSWTALDRPDVGCMINIGEVTHWMPIPKPPKEEHYDNV